MAATELSATEATFAATTDWSIAVPTGVQVGYLLLAFAANSVGTGTFAAPAGWTVGQLVETTISDCVLGWAWKVATDTELTGSIAFSWGGVSLRDGVGVLICYSDVAASPMDTAPVLLTQASGTTYTSSSITPTVNGCLIVACATNDGSAGNPSPQYGSWTFGSDSGTERHDFRDGTAYETMGSADYVQATAAAVTASVVRQTADVGVMLIAAIAPAPVSSALTPGTLRMAGESAAISRASRW